MSGPSITASLLLLFTGVVLAAPGSEYDRGIALARAGHWEEARRVLKTGERKNPRDPRFPIELAGVAFRRRRYPEAVCYLRRALQLDPGSAYANDFLATVYLLKDNLPAALKYWNRIGKPHIVRIERQPEPLVDSVLLDRAFAIAPASVLRLPDLYTTESRLSLLGIFPRWQFRLMPREKNRFDLEFRSIEHDGWGDSTSSALLALLRGLPYETIYPEVFDIGRSAMNFRSLFRWDSNKRRVFASLSAPLHRDPRWRYRFYLDGRQENWDLSRTFHASPVPVTGLRLDKIEAGAELASSVNGDWSWTAGVALGDRRIRIPDQANLFPDGLSLKYRARMDHVLWRLPERRFRVDSSASGQFGKLFATGTSPFANLRGSLEATWYPRLQGDDYRTTAKFHAGKSFGTVPFDELFILGIERDNDLWLRGHVGTHDGRKGSAPLGRDYALFNWDLDKNIYQGSFVNLKMGPFVDSGRIYDSTGGFGSGKWLWDVGPQVKFGILDMVSVTFTYGKDLRGGGNAFYFTVSR